MWDFGPRVLEFEVQGSGHRLCFAEVLSGSRGFLDAST